jgi:hypothetical protein
VDGVYDHRGIQYEHPHIRSREVLTYLPKLSPLVSVVVSVYMLNRTPRVYSSRSIFLSYFRCVLHFHTFSFSTSYNMRCAALCIYCCRLHPTRSTCKVPRGWKTSSRVPAPHYDYVCHVRRHHISHPGMGTVDTDIFSYDEQ